LQIKPPDNIARNLWISRLKAAPSKCLDIRKRWAFLYVTGLRAFPKRGIGETVIALRYFP
jgi:hypothetical protein